MIIQKPDRRPLILDRDIPTWKTFERCAKIVPVSVVHQTASHPFIVYVINTAVREDEDPKETGNDAKTITSKRDKS